MSVPLNARNQNAPGQSAPLECVRTRSCTRHVERHILSRRFQVWLAFDKACLRRYSSSRRGRTFSRAFTILTYSDGHVSTSTAILLQTYTKRFSFLEEVVNVRFAPVGFVSSVADQRECSGLVTSNAKQTRENGKIAKEHITGSIASISEEYQRLGLRCSRWSYSYRRPKLYISYTSEVPSNLERLSPGIKRSVMYQRSTGMHWCPLAFRWCGYVGVLNPSNRKLGRS